MTPPAARLEGTSDLTELSATQVFRIAFADIAALAFEKGQLSERARRDAMARENFTHYFTPMHAERIATDPHAARLGGETRPAAVLFSDVRGFTGLTETMDPPSTARLLSEMFAELVECVIRSGGTVDKFMGDAVMAQWGAPETLGDEADRAIEAALDMLNALDALNARWDLEQRPMLQMGIGLGFGNVFAGTIGSDLRLEYTLIGDAVNTASRLCAAAGAGEILVSDEFRCALHGPWVLTPLPPLRLKGKSRPILAHRVER
ncbi:MAG: hypothetical protein B7Z72_11290 [Gemmatimonadetes bacterium 21-71-4]|nr:MAG: hypothetical protein B7Z72_11290 [Gemmatimonadetes bacterium 21-71-4]